MIYLGADHGGYELKEAIKAHLQAQGIACTDCGTHSAESVDYAPIAKATCEKLLADSDKSSLAVLCCGTGIGISMAANKVKGAYAANVGNVYAAKRACLSNNCNIITIGCQTTGNMLAKELISAYLKCEYVYNERSGKKVDAIVEYEQTH